MLTIRLQRTGRKGHSMFRMVVQDARRTPTSGKVVAYLGSYDPHNKTTSLTKEKAKFYLEHGAQPSPRVVRLLTSEGVDLPKWVKVSAPSKGAIRNPEKLRRNRPPEAEAPVVEETPAVEDEASTPEAVEDTTSEKEVEVEAGAEVEKPEETEPEQPLEKADEPQK